MSDLVSFSKSFLEDIIEESKTSTFQLEDIFVDRFCGYLVDAEECFDYQLCNYKKKGRGIKINAYSYVDDFDTVTLFVSDFDNLKSVRKLGKKTLFKRFNSGLNFYKSSLKGLKGQIEESDDAFSLADLLESNANSIRKLKIVVITNSIAVNDVPEDIKLGNTLVTHHIWDIERLYQFIYENKGTEELKINFTDEFIEELNLIKTPDCNEIYDSYVGVISGKLLAEIYDKWGQRLIERNVRSFLQAKAQINKGIRDTITKEAHMFMAYNNGISTIAESAVLNKPNNNVEMYQVKELIGWQIVNGGQTTASLYNAYKNDVSLDRVFVQLKLTVIKEKSHIDNIISSISRYANSQNKITMSDFSANDIFHVTLENLSRTIWVPSVGLKGKAESKWFYERARGQYLVEYNRQISKAKKDLFLKQNPKSQLISKTIAAKYEMSWNQYPHTVSKGAETNFVEFMELIKENKVKPDADYFKTLIAKGILFNTCDKIVKGKNFGGYKANVVAYTVAIFSFIHNKEIDFISIWNNQGIEDTLIEALSTLCEYTWEHITNPPVAGTNITQWCKKEECWTLFKGKMKNFKPLEREKATC
ncbi:AIPR family protein [Ammoniphilus sp. CFH 90114]|uniref:AIPR family protein n=1 Tax=Ammoniphilus sp. CFH 90114 TaxID=2493665 RepID=UPI00100F1137|nr:AIPR family protein [Ammoniphilus sp. CFH 90114]RXT14889.1 hypothetical protein EIZ39_01365 [Ammoniphilus sp. CFH 90114]